jgi:hypothetical protein
MYIYTYYYNFISRYRPGGKYGPTVEEVSKEDVDQLAVGEELKRAAKVVKASLKVGQQ